MRSLDKEQPVAGLYVALGLSRQNHQLPPRRRRSRIRKNSSHKLKPRGGHRRRTPPPDSRLPPFPSTSKQRIVLHGSCHRQRNCQPEKPTSSSTTTFPHAPLRPMENRRPRDPAHRRPDRPGFPTKTNKKPPATTATSPATLHCFDLRGSATTARSLPSANPTPSNTCVSTRWRHNPT